MRKFQKINPILRKIVSTEDGTAGFANVKGYDIGGKTGTADIASAGGYSKKDYSLQFFQLLILNLS